MIPVSTTIEEQHRITGIKVRTESGKPAKVDEQDEPIRFETADGSDGEGVVENVREYTEGSLTGTEFDVVLRKRTPGASVVTLKADADNDAGEVRLITEDFNITTAGLEAAGFEFPAGTNEPIAEA
jgi:hypothetical protein